MNRFFRRILILFVLAVLPLLGGCYSGDIDQYFSLPQASGEHVQLQALIDAEIAAGCEYAAPVGGSHRQSVQLFDPDGDGTSEALAFFREKSGKPKIVLYRLEKGGYTPALTLSGDGTSVGSVNYSDLDGDGIDELMISWKMAPGMNSLSVYRLRDWSGEILLSTDCAEYSLADLNRDGRDELMILRSAGSSYLADMYSFTESGAQASTAALSADIGSLKRVRGISLSDGVPALLVESSLVDGDLVSDIFLCRDGSLINLTLSRSTGISGARRSYSLAYAQDMNGDGVIEIPMPQRLYSDGGEVFWSIAWYDYDSSGRTALVMTTYHNFSDGWYLILPDGWENGLTVRRDDDISGEHSLTLCRLETDGSSTELVTVVTLTGENRYERARTDGRFILKDNDSTIYAAAVRSADVSRDTIAKNFNLIYTEWSTGSV